MSEELNELINSEVPLDAPPLFYLSEPCDQLMTALSAAAADLENPKKDNTARVPTKAGGEYSYKYADLATTLAGLRPVLAKHGLALIQCPFVRSDGPCLLTIIAHKSGQRIMSRLDMPVSFEGMGKDAAKDLGSAITYLRRYAVTSAFPIASDEDTDIGNIQGQARPIAAQPKAAPRAAATAPVTAKAAAEAWPGQAKFLEDCRIEYKRLGKSAFFAALGSFGFERPEDVPDRTKARKVYDDLFERVSPDVNAAITNKHGATIDNDDLPEELGGRA